MPFGNRINDLSWLGALIVSEGTICTNNRYIEMAITNTDKEIIDEAIRITSKYLPIKMYTEHRYNDKAGWRKVCYFLNIGGGYREKLKFLHMMRPYLIGRKAEIADIMINFASCRYDLHRIPLTVVEERMLEGINRLNKKGGGV